jgi:uncharacterized protein (DUF362 family)
MLPLLSIVSDPALHYPEGNDCFSPDEPFPEYRYGVISARPNPVYHSVRRLFAQSGLDREYCGTPEWNPLGRYIVPGSRVFVLCNFVYHRKPGESLRAFWSKCTHGSVLRALLDYVLIAVGPGGTVTFGNAPLQSCEWEKVLDDTGAARVLDFYRSQNVDVLARDLRLFAAKWNRLGNVSDIESRNGSPVEVDLGAHSLLTVFDSHQPHFRVSDYDPRRTETYQNSGRHIYAVSPTILESDVIISLPKLKTHEKVGITCGLKGLVGTIALKDSLAHHRFGGPHSGGDEYASDSPLLRAASRFHDWVQQQDAGKPGASILQILDRNNRRLLARSGHIVAGAWYGNDTAWRMALDIGQVVTYATRSGELSTTPQRKHLMLVDGVIGGEGNGPLSPSPVDSRVLLLSDNLAVGDLACCCIMGLDPLRIPLVRNALEREGCFQQASITADFNGEKLSLPDLPRSAVHAFAAPKGWRGHMETKA